MADLERTYNIPLRKAWLKAPNYKRTKRAVNFVKEFTIKHMKVDEVKIGKYLNEALWQRGYKNPPHKVAVRITKTEDKDKKLARVELVDAPQEAEKIEAPKEIKKEEKKETKEEKEKKETRGKQQEDLKKAIEEKDNKEVKEKPLKKEDDLKSKEYKVVHKPQKPHHEKKK